MPNLEFIVEVLDDENVWTRIELVQKLYRIDKYRTDSPNRERPLSVLTKALNHERSRAASAFILGRIGDPTTAIEGLIKALIDES